MEDLFLVTLYPFLLSLALPSKMPTCAPGGRNFCNVSYIDNRDADEIIVDIPGLPDVFGKNLLVRVRGIAAAKRSARDACEREAAGRSRDIEHRWLQSVKEVDLKDCVRTKEFELKCTVEMDGKPLIDVLLADGSVLPDAAAPKKDWCKYLKSLDR